MGRMRCDGGEDRGAGVATVQAVGVDIEETGDVPGEPLRRLRTISQFIGEQRLG